MINHTEDSCADVRLSEVQQPDCNDLAPSPCEDRCASVSSLCFSVPRPDLHSFVNDLNPRARKLVQRRLRAMAIIHRAKARTGSVFPACQQIAAQFHMERGWSAKRLHALYLSFCESGDWRTLVDAAIAGPAWQNSLTPGGLPVAFLHFLAQKLAGKQRGKFASAYSSLLLQLERWRGGDPSAAVPGYAEPPQGVGVRDLPAGWTYGNLQRAVKPHLSKFAGKHIRIGPKAASSYGPQIPGTRVGLSVGRYYILDDSWNDAKVTAYNQTARLLSFHALDLLSACNIARGYKPAIKDANDIEQRLREKEIVWLVVKLLTEQGYLGSGTVIICEKATATIRERERRILADCGIPITVEDGPAGGGPGISALFTGPGGGNPRWKAPLESWFNLLRNRTDDLLEFPGQTGSMSRINQPEGLPGLEKDTLALMRAARSLTPERAELLRLGMLPLHEAIFKYDAITEVINCRIDHDLEGWRDCGHFINEFRLPLTPGSALSPLSASGGEGQGERWHNGLTRWMPTERLLDFDPSEREAIAAVLKNSSNSCNSCLSRERALSPREVFDAGRDRLTKLPIAVASLLMEELPGSEEIVRNCQLSISVPEVDPDAPLKFGLMRRDGQGTQTPLRNEEKYLVRVNPLSPNVAWLYDAKNKPCGVVPYYGKVGRDNPEQLKRAFAAKKQALRPLVEEAHRLAAPIIQAETERHAHNARVLNRSVPLTDSEKSNAAAVQAEGPAAADAILSTPVGTTSTSSPSSDADAFLSALTSNP